MKSSRIPAALLSIVAALTLAACGQHEPDEVTGQKVSGAETEGIYIDVDNLKYQVQVSKQLNPLSTSDKDYLEGVSATDLQLADDEVFFAILMRVENDDRDRDAIESTDDFEIVDSQNLTYEPIPLDPSNNFAYRASSINGGDTYPLINSTPGERPPYGSLVLFKLKRESLGNRPLELHVKSTQSEQEGEINLDV